MVSDLHISYAAYRRTLVLNCLQGEQIENLPADATTVARRERYPPYNRDHYRYNCRWYTSGVTGYIFSYLIAWRTASLFTQQWLPVDYARAAMRINVHSIEKACWRLFSRTYRASSYLCRVCRGNKCIVLL